MGREREGTTEAGQLEALILALGKVGTSTADFSDEAADMRRFVWTIQESRDSLRALLIEYQQAVADCYDVNDSMMVGPADVRTIAHRRDELRAEVERLRAMVERQDRGGLPCGCEFDNDGLEVEWCMHHAEKRDRLTALEARNAALVEALRPFAALGNLVPADFGDDRIPIFVTGIRASDLRAAARALNDAKGADRCGACGGEGTIQASILDPSYRKPCPNGCKPQAAALGMCDCGRPLVATGDTICPYCADT